MKQQLSFLLIFLFSSCSIIVKPIAGDFEGKPEELNEKVSDRTKALINKSFEGIKEHLDYHVHAVGMGTDHTHNWVNPHMTSWLEPYKNLQYNVYMNASGITDLKHADKQYVERLVSVMRAEPRYGKGILFAFDYNYTPDGKLDKEHSSFHIPNEYVWELSTKYPDLFIPCASIHPDRPDALQELDKWGKVGVRCMKWLPNSQRIDASLEKHRPFYQKLKDYGFTLIVHTGHEKAVEGDENQELGNPLRLKLPLEMGVNITMAHLASLGDCHDHENNDVMVSCFDLFWRMFQNPKYESNLRGEMSGTTLYTRVGKPLLTVLEHPELHYRLVDGSDYPLPAINILYRTKQFLDLGYITKEEKESLNEIYDYNPLLFDFVLKRTLKHPKTKQQLTNILFEAKLK
ncbi:MAG: hypothetical protein COW00_03430 [Bdellovibrio sp. CG12_big_fil_rev_8_21_14_0_65_39_13]|nr:MAG: hypothetical protein COW78_10835 [Bdellovibrio sp. CG22_combo_CG10-13_8_21_14_all_39_27]PIQ61629.1 MAG: hypothetical protein COW00_03430 [Bdellovibrio sp. CG12_big_fil_rev_8_21_14_0_65_39_13]PIR35692.1 MAG: hypothetical protein COV37_07225 [Bdellovibrio sp. CG11_big_fil_rev_8_21_14_0_20_39_38]PJB53129.1 MAG: hypothetical protein CO099_08840 [Bdellovibrio sp. CG_4_9_14_3_um_filter_39_7]